MTTRRRRTNATNRATEGEPLFTISVAARLVSLTPQTIRACEAAGILTPFRSDGRQRFYSQQQVELLQRVKTLMVDMGLNMAGVEVALRLMERVTELEREIDQIRESAALTQHAPPHEEPGILGSAQITRRGSI
ncbi:MAG: MerR family transcriptional regulator [SAR202 cluster bacterium]|nr:MerR family transcriptional regulator [SAR202 cluster bacterium]